MLKKKRKKTSSEVEQEPPIGMIGQSEGEALGGRALHGTGDVQGEPSG